MKIKKIPEQCIENERSMTATGRTAHNPTTTSFIAHLSLLLLLFIVVKNVFFFLFLFLYFYLVFNCITNSTMKKRLSRPRQLPLPATIDFLYQELFYKIFILFFLFLYKFYFVYIFLFIYIYKYKYSPLKCVAGVASVLNFKFNSNACRHTCPNMSIYIYI